MSEAKTPGKTGTCRKACPRTMLHETIPTSLYFRITTLASVSVGTPYLFSERH